MPRSTFAYWFEMKVLGLAGALAERFADQATGDDESQPWLFTFDDDGEPRCVPLPASGWRQVAERVKADGRAYLLHDPFDAPEYQWLEWGGLDRQHVERLLGEPLAAKDLTPLRDPDAGPIEFPRDHGVMF
ncbi:MAG: hypothetical protein KC420_09825 [Myxococcales bacterium]|nr:hypothetical protein [Myxococcales bacterium]